MTYQKILVDNPSCQRRFHVGFDDSDDPVDQTTVACPYCSAEVLSKKAHPPVTLLRQENLVRTQELSETLTYDCLMKDEHAERTQRLTYGDRKFVNEEPTKAP